jgi:hypothetical protein
VSTCGWPIAENQGARGGGHDRVIAYVSASAGAGIGSPVSDPRGRWPANGMSRTRERHSDPHRTQKSKAAKRSMPLQEPAPESEGS